MELKLMISIDLICKKLPEKIALHDSSNNSVTYRDLEILLEKLSPCFDSRSLVFILTTNTIDCVVLYLTCLKNGHIPLLLPSDIASSKLNNLSTVYSPSFICSPKGYSYYGSTRRISLGCLEKYDIWKLPKANHHFHDDLALLLTTSGSTGNPKIAKISYENIFSNMSSIVKYLGITDQDSHVTTLPLCYTYGLSCIHTHLYVGGTIYLTDSSVIERSFWSFYEKCKPTSISGVPYTYELMNKFGVSAIYTAKLRYVTQAGGKLNPRLYRLFTEYLFANNILFFSMYGQTEATARMSYVPADMYLKKRGSIGIPIDGGVFSIINKADDGHGELVYTGKNVFMGYANSSRDLSLDDINNGVLHTGDLAYIDEDGYAYLVGRKKRFAKLNGLRLDLDYLQTVLTDSFSPCAILSDDKFIYIYIERTSESRPSLDLYYKDIKKFMHEACALQPRFCKVNCIETLPRTHSGKIAYGELFNDQ